MFIQVATTLLKSASLLSTLFVAFAVTFHKLLMLPEEACFQEFEEATREHKNRLAYCFRGFEHLNQSADVLGSRAKMGLQIKVYDSIGWALFQTLMMMVGEYDHTQLIVEPYLDGMSATIYIPELTFPFFAAFVFLVPITLMNLLIGLAVGDIDQVRRSATQKLISQRVYWLDSLERRCPMWLYQRINVTQWVKKAVVSLPSRVRQLYSLQVENFLRSLVTREQLVRCTVNE
ncbi:hypothetical protein PHET_08441 [Paragonimus heterotremus]|uniref:Ion transport domain-containing protein n=1 Tax=Paragonimus heterotremus TaxID=100268 RepID=A0A8J4T6E5_9TREM|nr:hypothetical protein PHET_08441 [Paragonimus heterotremus]